MTPRVVVLVSGNGSNLQALMNANLELRIVLVVSNRKAAFALERANAADIATLYAPLKPYTDAGRSRAEYDADLAQKINLLEPDLIVLAGWMHVFSSTFLEGVRVPVINLHPALPGQFAGAHAIEEAYSAWLEGKITESGCMVHHVIPELDAGEAIATRVVPFIAGDTLETYAQRLHAAEHELIVEAVVMRLANPYVRYRRVQAFLMDDGQKYISQLSRDAQLHIESMLDAGEQQMALESFIRSVAEEKIGVKQSDIAVIRDFCLLAKLDIPEEAVFEGWKLFVEYVKMLGFQMKA